LIRIMANTNALKEIEQYVRSWCLSKYGVEFENQEKELRLITGGLHKFDVVSKDGTIVAGIKTSALRENGKVGVGVIKSTFTELYFLSLIKASTKLMILTNKGYYEHFEKISRGKVADVIKIIHCPLPQDAQEKIAIVHRNCRKEIGRR